MRLITTFTIPAILAMTLLTGCASTDNYIVQEEGRGTLRTVLDTKMDTPSEQWAYATELEEKGRSKKSMRAMLYLFRRWPNSREAPRAVRTRADMLMDRGELDDAFTAYQYLIDNYSSRMAEYDSVLERQFEIASDVMKRRRLRWILGGFRAPEYAVDYFESVLRNGPQWSRAPETQFMIGRCYQESGQYELAISAYGLLGYRYPDSRLAEEAAWSQIFCLQKMQKEYPHSPEMLDRLLTATTVFISTYPESDYNSGIIQMRNDLYEVKAGSVYDKATFYATVPKKPRAAILYDEALIEEYPMSRLVPRSEERIAELEALLDQPEEKESPSAPHAKPLPFG